MHACSRCGLESKSSRHSWPDRHPVAAALFAIPALYITFGVILAYPWFFVPLLVVGAALWVDRRNRRRAAVAARAEHEHQQQVLRELQRWPAGLPAAMVRPAQRRPPGADHWSATRPMRSGRR